MARGSRFEEGAATPPAEEPPPPQEPAPHEQKPSEISVIFGNRETQKTIGIIAGVAFVSIALIYFLLFKNDPDFRILALLFAALHGGLGGMLIGQLILVYPDRVMVLFTLMGVVVGESIFLAASGVIDKGFVFDLDTFHGLVAVFFWAGFVGFWLGFVAYARRVSARKRFQQRFQSPDRRAP